MDSSFKLSKKCLLIILDGFGINKNRHKNAVRDAKKPFLDHLFQEYPFTEVNAGGLAVGLPKGVCGNSEVGHMNLGSGRAIKQDLVRINQSIKNNTFKDLPELKNLIAHAKKTNNRIHLMGLLSDGGIHSHINHFKEIINILSKEKINLFFHAFMDGRDTAPNTGKKYVKDLLSIPGFHFASMQGRSIGMDRDERWERIQKSYQTLTGNGHCTDKSPEEWLDLEYEKEIYDEFITPTLFHSNFKMQNKDSLFFMNFRPDRATELALAFTDDSFKKFNRVFRPSFFLCMTPYIPDKIRLPILFDKEKINGTLSDFLSKQKVKQFKIAETEKYAHITYFFNGGEKKPFEGETHKLIPSPKDVETYDQKPEMSAYQVTEKLIEALNQDEHQFYLVNFANADMVGHTGNYQAAIRSIEVLDECMQKVIEKCSQENVTVFLTADHGNSDQMEYQDGTPHTSHTSAMVPFCLIHPKLKGVKLNLNHKDPALKDIAPTILHIMGIERPREFTGRNIFN